VPVCPGAHEGRVAAHSGETISAESSHQLSDAGDTVSLNK